MDPCVEEKRMVLNNLENGTRKLPDFIKVRGQIEWLHSTFGR
jgi:hypothetical protein